MAPTVNASVAFGARTPLCEDESPQGLLCIALPILSHMWLSEGFEVIAALDKFYWAGSNSKLSHWGKGKFPCCVCAASTSVFSFSFSLGDNH